jgi:hypothetical protein
VAAAGCSRRGAPPAAAVAPDASSAVAAATDEDLVAAYEEMGRIADRYGADCDRWAKENHRALHETGTPSFYERWSSRSVGQLKAFRAKYRTRLDAVRWKLDAVAGRCKDQLAAAVFGGGGARPAAVESDEDLVAAYEEMGRASDRTVADCQRWQAEQLRLINEPRTLRFYDRLLRDGTADDRRAFRARYEQRIEATNQKISAGAQRCKGPLTRALHEAPP